MNVFVCVLKTFLSFFFGVCLSFMCVFFLGGFKG